ncbi:MAG: FliA/WhiG family RNA polymerase sigma factor [Firmicutes bacterium]|nr:FliA/WhiG family RNA polymerase sigma factor [Dethiobacter sp.]MBS3888657.1 FliA/WhiG family RNA polymerase sigma factor [Bacillota bacterium]MBS4053319.1 FliA/WhiG family RNA polymerase sigma factor [Thermaerobacter sp.]
MKVQVLTSVETERETLLLSFLPLVRRIAGRIYIPSPGVLDKEDLISHGLVGLMEAVDKYDPSREISFESYVYRRVRGAMIDAIRTISFSPRTVNERVKQFREVEDKLRAQGMDISDEQVAREMGLSVAQVREVLGHIALRSLISLNRVLYSEEGEEVPVLQAVGSSSSPNPEAILEEADLQAKLAESLDKLPARDRQLLNLYYVEELTLKEIAAVFGVTEGRVSQLHARAIIRLREVMDYRT